MKRVSDTDAIDAHTLAKLNGIGPIELDLAIPRGLFSPLHWRGPDVHYDGVVDPGCFLAVVLKDEPAIDWPFHREGYRVDADLPDG